ncbi:MAG: succinate--CoA ligase subunit alpha [Nitrososphaerales archaeon]
MGLEILDKIYENPRVIVQGITGRYGSFHTKLMLDYGTNIVGGVTPGKGGQEVHGVRVYNTVEEVVRKTGALISVIFVPAPFFLNAALEAIKGGIKLLVAITEHVPIRDSLRVIEEGKKRGAIMVGPNSPGLIIPNFIKLGIMPAQSFKRGDIAIFSRSGTLMYEIAYHLSSQGLGQYMALGIGGDPINGLSLLDCLEYSLRKDEIKRIVLVGEIGGDQEERVAEYIKKVNFLKPIVAYIAGRYAPKEKKMGHAGAIIYGNYGTAESKIKALKDANALIAFKPSEIPKLVKEVSYKW